MWREIDPDDLELRGRYELLTSLVVPRPIAWIGSRSPEGVDNLAPFSYFAALSASPMLVGISIGHRPSGKKDSLSNILATNEFTISVVDEARLGPMNETSIMAPPEFDEFRHAGLEASEGARIAAPFVAEAPAVLECRLERRVPLDPAPNTLVIGRVVHVRLSADLRLIEGTLYVDTAALRPVGRLYGAAYAVDGRIVNLPRPIPVNDLENKE